MFLVLSGKLQIAKRVAQGAERILATLGKGQYVGELSLLTGAPRSATMQALEATDVIEIDQLGFMHLLQDQPHLCLELMHQLAHRLRETTEELIFTALEAALAQRDPRRAPTTSPRMQFIATGSCAPMHLATVLHLAATQAPHPALVTSLMRPGRTDGALVYVLETESPGDIFDLIQPFTGLVQWDIAPALAVDATLTAMLPEADGVQASRAGHDM